MALQSAHWYFTVFWILLAALCGLGTGNGAANAASQQSASLSGQIEPGARKVTRLRNLPAGATLAVEVQTDGPIIVQVIDESDLSAMPDPLRPLFAGRADAETRFTLTVPRGGNYYLVLANSLTAAARQFSFRVTASLEKNASGLEQITKTFEGFEADLRKLLVFDELEFRIGSCGRANAYSVDNVVLLCAEVWPMTLERAGNRADAGGVIVFMVMHELGHTLLRQWNFPSFDDEEVVDEFATMLLLMYGQETHVESAAKFFQSFDPIAETEARRGRDSRHPPPDQRARNLQRWLKDPDLVRRWQAFLVQHMQTNALKLLARNPKAWTDVSAIEAELLGRR